MMRPVLEAALALLPVVAAPAHAASAATLHSAERATECRIGPSGRSLSPDLRTNPVALCPYDVENLYRRIDRLLDNRDGRYVDIYKILWTFGLPRLVTAYDSDRIADYDVTVHGADGWTMQLIAKEASYPLDGKRAVFTPGLHPVRLVEIDALDAMYDITLRLPDGDTSPDHCLSIRDAADTLERAGWKDETFLAGASVTDGGRAHPTFRAPRGRSLMLLGGDVASRKEWASHCLTGLTIIQPPRGGAGEGEGGA